MIIFFSDIKWIRNKQVKAREYRDGARTSVRNPSDTERNTEMRSIQRLIEEFKLLSTNYNG